MPRFLAPVVLLALLLGVPVAGAGDDSIAGGAHLTLQNPTVLVSPGCPEALLAHLPGSGPQAPWLWPLPDGPLLLLGLPEDDPLAFELGMAWGLLPPCGDLAGGYVRCAWHDGTRPIGVVLAADAAALYAAREVLQSVDDDTLHVRRAWHFERPRFRIRAIYPMGRPAERLISTAIAGRANQVWIDGEREIRHVRERLLPELRRHGIVPVVELRLRDEEAEPASLAARAGLWRDRAGIEHFALSPPELDDAGEALAAAVEAVRASGPVTQIFTRSVDDGLAGTWTFWPPDAPPEPRRTPLLFWESWAHASRTPVPSAPYGRTFDPAAFCDGVVVMDGPGLEAVLRDAWKRVSARPAWESTLLPLLPRGDLAPDAFLEAAAARLEKEAAATRNAIPWLAPLAAQIREDLPRTSGAALLVPRVPASIDADGHLDEPAWAWAARIEIERADGLRLEILLVADGRELAVAARGPADLDELVLVVRAASDTWDQGSGGVVGDPERTLGGVWRKAAHGVTWEGVLDRSALSGDAHPTRVFGLDLWERAPPENRLRRRRITSLVLGP